MNRILLASVTPRATRLWALPRPSQKSFIGSGRGGLRTGKGEWRERRFAVGSGRELLTTGIRWFDAGARTDELLSFSAP